MADQPKFITDLSARVQECHSALESYKEATNPVPIYDCTDFALLKAFKVVGSHFEDHLLALSLAQEGSSDPGEIPSSTFSPVREVPVYYLDEGLYVNYEGKDVATEKGTPDQKKIQPYGDFPHNPQPGEVSPISVSSSRSTRNPNEQLQLDFMNKYQPPGPGYEGTVNSVHIKIVDSLANLASTEPGDLHRVFEVASVVDTVQTVQARTKQQNKAVIEEQKSALAAQTQSAQDAFSEAATKEWKTLSQLRRNILKGLDNLRGDLKNYVYPTSKTKLKKALEEVDELQNQLVTVSQLGKSMIANWLNKLDSEVSGRKEFFDSTVKLLDFSYETTIYKLLEQAEAMTKTLIERKLTRPQNVVLQMPAFQLQTTELNQTLQNQVQVQGMTSTLFSNQQHQMQVNWGQAQMSSEVQVSAQPQILSPAQAQAQAQVQVQVQAQAQAPGQLPAPAQAQAPGQLLAPAQAQAQAPGQFPAQAQQLSTFELQEMHAEPMAEQDMQKFLDSASETLENLVGPVKKKAKPQLLDEKMVGQFKAKLGSYLAAMGSSLLNLQNHYATRSGSVAAAFITYGEGVMNQFGKACTSISLQLKDGGITLTAPVQPAKPIQPKNVPGNQVKVQKDIGPFNYNDPKDFPRGTECAVSYSAVKNLIELGITDSALQSSEDERDGKYSEVLEHCIAQYAQKSGGDVRYPDFRCNDQCKYEDVGDYGKLATYFFNQATRKEEWYQGQTASFTPVFWEGYLDCTSVFSGWYDDQRVKVLPTTMTPAHETDCRKDLLISTDWVCCLHMARLFPLSLDPQKFGAHKNWAAMLADDTVFGPRPDSEKTKKADLYSISCAQYNYLTPLLLARNMASNFCIRCHDWSGFNVPLDNPQGWGLLTHNGPGKARAMGFGSPHPFPLKSAIQSLIEQQKAFNKSPLKLDLHQCHGFSCLPISAKKSINKDWTGQLIMLNAILYDSLHDAFICGQQNQAFVINFVISNMLLLHQNKLLEPELIDAALACLARLEASIAPISFQLLTGSVGLSAIVKTPCFDANTTKPALFDKDNEATSLQGVFLQQVCDQQASTLDPEKFSRLKQAPNEETLEKKKQKVRSDSRKEYTRFLSLQVFLQQMIEQLRKENKIGPLERVFIMEIFEETSERPIQFQALVVDHSHCDVWKTMCDIVYRQGDYSAESPINTQMSGAIQFRCGFLAKDQQCISIVPKKVMERLPEEFQHLHLFKQNPAQAEDYYKYLDEHQSRQRSEKREAVMTKTTISMFHAVSNLLNPDRLKNLTFSQAYEYRLGMHCWQYYFYKRDSDLDKLCQRLSNSYRIRLFTPKRSTNMGLGVLSATYSHFLSERNLAHASFKTAMYRAKHATEALSLMRDRFYSGSTNRYVNLQEVNRAMSPYLLDHCKWLCNKRSWQNIQEEESFKTVQGLYESALKKEFDLISRCAACTFKSTGSVEAYNYPDPDRQLVAHLLFNEHFDGLSDCLKRERVRQKVVRQARASYRNENIYESLRFLLKLEGVNRFYDAEELPMSDSDSEHYEGDEYWAAQFLGQEDRHSDDYHFDSDEEQPKQRVQPNQSVETNQPVEPVSTFEVDQPQLQNQSPDLEMIDTTRRN